MTLNLKDPKGVEVFRRLVEKADVVVENFLPDVKARLGIDSCANSTRAWSMAASPASARMAPITSALALIRSPKAWAG